MAMKSLFNKKKSFNAYDFSCLWNKMAKSMSQTFDCEIKRLKDQMY